MPSYIHVLETFIGKNFGELVEIWHFVESTYVDCQSEMWARPYYTYIYIYNVYQMIICGKTFTEGGIYNATKFPNVFRLYIYMYIQYESKKRFQ